MRVAIDDFNLIKRLSDLTVSPDGTKAALTVTVGNMEKNGYDSDIWLYENGNMRRLTSGHDGSRPFWLDDENILFPSDRAKEATKDQKLTVFNRINIHGGEAQRYFSVPMKVTTLKKYKAGLFFMTAQYDNAEENHRPDMGYTVFDELPFWFNGRGVINKIRNRLYILDPKNNTHQPITDPLFETHGYAYDEQTDCLAYWGIAFDTVNRQKSSVYIRNMTNGETITLPLNNEYRVSSCMFSMGSLIMFASRGEKIGTSAGDRVYEVNPATGDFTLLHNPDVYFGSCVGSDVHGGGPGMAARPEGIYHLETLGYRSHICLMTKDQITNLTPQTHAVDSFDEKCGTIFYVAMDFNGLQELYVRKPNGDTACVSSFNQAYLNSHELSIPEAFSFIDSDGVEIDGWVMKPVDYVPGKSYPAILDVHGGPKVVYGDVFFHEMQYWCAKGYYVFFCNPRGSAGKGDDFADIMGVNYGVRDYHDLMEFTDEVLKRNPDIDPKRVCMTGGSYGGFMANWIIGHTDRFAAVASQRSISNYLSKCLTTDIGYYHNLSAIQADPWNNMQQMWDHSPLKYADKATTPTLFIQSDEDYRCWMGDAIQMLQALLMHGVPAKMCLFHGENHELSRSGKPKNRVSRLDEITKWFDQYTKC